jgi:tetratricopeptide (TPR) repeat protein
MDRAEAWTADLLQVLQLSGVLLAVLVVLGLLVGLVRSLFQVALGRSTLVVPFSGGDSAAWVADIVAEQLDAVEAAVVDKHQAVRAVAAKGQDASSHLQLGPAARFLPEQPLDEHTEKFVVEHPISGQAIGPITLLGATFSPDFLFAAFYRLRGLAARKTVRGSLYRLGATARLSSQFTFAKHASPGQPSKTRVTRTLVVQRRVLEADGQMLDMVDDLAFGIVRERMALDAGTPSWAAYSTFLDAYIENLRFLSTGEIARRDRALDLYLSAVALDQSYQLAAYNAACLLYNRYRESENAKAIAFYGTAAASEDATLRPLALAGLTMAYAQNVHRYGLGPVPWVELADLTSQQALGLRPDLEETRFARAWAFQLAERVDEAINEYASIATLEGDSLPERQMKSFAANNQAFLMITKKDDLEGAKAILERVVELYPNKMVYANLADIARREGDLDAALNYYGEARALDPLYANAHNETALVYLAKARGERDPVHQAALFVTAEEWHSRALGVVPEIDTNQRRSIEDAYQAALAAVPRA